MKHLIPALVLLAFAPLAQAQNLEDSPAVKALASNASDNVDLSFSGPMLHFASSFLDDSDEDDVAVKELLAQLKRLSVHSYTFASEQPGLSKQSAESLRAALPATQWVRLISEREHAGRSSVDIYTRQERGQTTGMVLIAAEPKEFTLIEAEGSLTAEQLRKLAKHFAGPAPAPRATRSDKSDKADWVEL